MNEIFWSHVTRLEVLHFHWLREESTLTYGYMGYQATFYSGETTSEINLNGYLGNPITDSIALP